MNLIPFYTGIQQRLGFVNALVTLTSPDSFTSKEILSKQLFDLVKDKQSNWLKKSRSSTGGIVEKTANDIIDWAISLDLLFQSTFSWRPEARLLENLISDEEYDAFHENLSYNPLNISMAERLFYLHKFLINDGIALVYLIDGLKPRTSWTRKEAAEILQEVYERYGQMRKRSAQSTSDYAEANAIIALAERMKKSRKGVVGTKALRVTPRLEVLVDLHMIDKPAGKKGLYVYCRNEHTNRFNEKFNDWTKNDDIDSDFFQACAYIYKLSADPASDEEIFQTVISNFPYMSAAYGLAGIDEVCLLSAVKAMTSKPPKVMEINKARKVLIEYQMRYQNDIKLHVDQRGRIRYFSVSKDFLAEFTP